ncbi:MAG TPA: TlpA disulfide reductase family protein [Hanamia sp.]|nr:TlpA disulfide reductase family protein [Hanamia sp.]
MKNISKSILAFLISIVFCSKSFSQESGIKIGETCPDVVLSHIINFKTDHARISDFKGKLLILDFWATWCAPCVSMIPVTDSLQKEFEGKIQILPVTDQDASTATAFLNNIKHYKNILMPSVTNDTELRTLFPHVEIPHYVWLDENSKVIAITGAEQLTGDIIKDFLNKKRETLPIKEDQYKTIPEHAPMFVIGNEIISGNTTHFEKIDNSALLYHSVITKYIDGFGCEQGTDTGRITCKNSSIGDLYRMAASHYKLINLGFNSTIWETNNEIVKRMSDSAVTVHSKTRAEIYDWMRQYDYCYELKFPSKMNDRKYDLMLQDLNNYFGAMFNIVGSMERRKTNCLVLIKTSKSKMPDTSATKNQYSINPYHLQLKNASVSQFIALLSINLDTFPPLVDETHDDEKMDIDINCNLSDINSLNKALMPYGLKLVEKIAERDMIVIKDKPLIK